MAREQLFKDGYLTSFTYRVAKQNLELVLKLHHRRRKAPTSVAKSMMAIPVLMGSAVQRGASAVKVMNTVEMDVRKNLVLVVCSSHTIVPPG